MLLKKITKIIMVLGLALIFLGVVTFNLEFPLDPTCEESCEVFNVEFILWIGVAIAGCDTIYYCGRYIRDLVVNRNTRIKYGFVTKDTSTTDRCALLIKKKVELFADVEFDSQNNPQWNKAVNRLREQMIEQGLTGIEISKEQLVACLKLCRYCGFKYMYYVELKQKWVWQNSRNGEGFERYLVLCYRKWGDEYTDANIHDEELFGALSDAECGLCWLVKWGDAREWVPIFHSKMTLTDAHAEIRLANAALQKLKDGKDLDDKEAKELSDEAHKGFKSEADANQIKEGVILIQNAYCSQLSTQDVDLRLENASLDRKLQNALETIEIQRQYAEDLFDTEIAGISQQAKQESGIRLSGSAIAGIIVVFLILIGFIGYLLQFTGWFKIA